jgi:hypothetical protein
MTENDENKMMEVILQICREELRAELARAGGDFERADFAASRLNVEERLGPDELRVLRALDEYRDIAVTPETIEELRAAGCQNPPEPDSVH